MARKKSGKSPSEADAYTLAAALGAKTNGIPKPPKSWWDEHVEKIREEHPDYNNGQIAAAVGRIWFKIYDSGRREAAIIAAALHET